jgi:hypothetical protein
VIELIGLLDCFLGILTMIHNLLEQLILIPFLVYLTQEVFGEKVIGDLLPFAV